jgi:tetratricopeptide (TPR) repeat protein
MLVVAVPFRAQDGSDTKAKLEQAVAAARKAYESGSFEQAEDLLRGAASAVHDDAKAVLLRAKVNFELGEFGKASAFAERAAELDANDFDARFLAGKAKFQQAEALKGSPLNSGSRVNGFYESALGDFDKALKIKPDNLEAQSSKAQALFWLDRVPEAMKIYEDLKKAKPDDPEPYLRIAQAQQLARNDDAALKAAIAGLTTKGPSNLRGDLATIMFNILGPRQKYAELFAAFKAWSAAHPQDPLAYLWMGYTRFMERNVEEAITHYQKGFEISGKKHGGLALELGNAFMQKGDLAKAAEWYGTALKVQPEWPDYKAGPLWMLNGVAGTFVQKLEFQKAIEALEKNAFPAGNADWHTLNNLGLFYRDWAGRGKKAEGKSKNEKSLEYYLKASKLVLEDQSATPSEKAQVLNDTGVIYDYQLGNIEKGVESYRQALQNDPEYRDALENLGLCFNKLGKYEEAIPLFQKVLDQDGGRAVSRKGMAEAKKAVEKDGKPASR